LLFVSPVVPMRCQGRPRRHSRSHLQTQCRKNNSSRRLERPREASDWPRQLTCSQRTGWSLEDRRKASRWIDADPMEGYKCATWDVTVTDTLAVSYLPATSSTAGTASNEGAADRKELKYQSIAHTHTFIPLAFEKLGHINSKCTGFFNQLGRRISSWTSDKREIAFLFQRLSLTIQRLNAVCFNGSVCFNNADLCQSSPFLCCFSQFFVISINIYL